MPVFTEVNRKDGDISVSGDVNVGDDLSVADDFTIADGGNVIVGSTTGTKIGTATTQKIGFFNKTPVVQPTALTPKLTTITYTAPATPDYAIQDLQSNNHWGFASKDEGNTVLSVIASLQTRVDELETKLVALGLLAA